VPKLRSRTIELDLPECNSPEDVVAAFDVTVAAMAAGEITPDEALTVSRVLDRRRRAIEARARRRGRTETPAEIVGTGETDVVGAMAAGEITPAEALAASPRLDRRSLARAEELRVRARRGEDANSADPDLHSSCNFSFGGDEVAAADDLVETATGPDQASAGPVDTAPAVDGASPPTLMPQMSDLHPPCNCSSCIDELPVADTMATAIGLDETSAAAIGTLSAADATPTPPLAPAAPDLHPPCNSRRNGTIRGVIAWRPRHGGGSGLDRRPARI
jgi:hypothetical protein